MPKLPADLPENWTQGQTISPNGTETGLTEQHGYNYLMKQVNNTQTEVNNINGALPDVAQQATVNEIKNKIGTEADADTQPTLFGRLAKLKNVLLEKLAELLTKITGIDGKIGTSGDTAGSATLFGQVKDISENMPTGIIKSVQRGVVNAAVGTTSGKEVSITIATVDPDKCLVTLYTGFFKGATTECFGNGAYVTNLTSTELKIMIMNKQNSVENDNKLSWEISEFF